MDAVVNANLNLQRWKKHNVSIHTSCENKCCVIIIYLLVDYQQQTQNPFINYEQCIDAQNYLDKHMHIYVYIYIYIYIYIY